jgi:tricorn protease
VFTFSNWEGSVVQLGEDDSTLADDGQTAGVRYRLPYWLAEGKRLIAVTDESGEETFVIFNQVDGQAQAKLISTGDIGRPMELAVNPVKDQIVFSNHRYELLLLDLESEQLRLIDHGMASHIRGLAGRRMANGSHTAHRYRLSRPCSSSGMSRVVRSHS